MEHGLASVLSTSSKGRLLISEGIDLSGHVLGADTVPCCHGAVSATLRALVLESAGLRSS